MAAKKKSQATGIPTDLQTTIADWIWDQEQLDKDETWHSHTFDDVVIALKQLVAGSFEKAMKTFEKEMKK